MKNRTINYSNPGSQEEKSVRQVCENCGKEIVNNKWNKEYHHINITQKPVKHFFCSRQCKVKWIFNLSTF